MENPFQIDHNHGEHTVQQSRFPTELMQGYKNYIDKRTLLPPFKICFFQKEFVQLVAEQR